MKSRRRIIYPGGDRGSKKPFHGFVFGYFAMISVVLSILPFTINTDFIYFREPVYYPVTKNATKYFAEIRTPAETSSTHQLCRDISLMSVALKMTKFSIPKKAAALRKAKHVFNSVAAFYLDMPGGIFTSVTRNIQTILEGYGMKRITDKKLFDQLAVNHEVLLVENAFLAGIRNVTMCVGESCDTMFRLVIQSEQHREFLPEYLIKCHQNPNCLIWEYSESNYAWESKDYNLTDSVMIVPTMIQNRFDHMAPTSESILPPDRRDIDVVFFGLMNSRRIKLNEQIMKLPSVKQTKLEQNTNTSHIVDAYGRAKICLIAHRFGVFEAAEFHRLTDFIRFGCVPVVEKWVEKTGADEFQKCGGLVMAEYENLPKAIERVLTQDQDTLHEMQHRLAWWEKGIDWSSFLNASVGPRQAIRTEHDRISVEKHSASKPNSQHPLTRAVFRDYDTFITNKARAYSETCIGWADYKEWIERLFTFAPHAPDCDTVKNFTNAYNDTSSWKGPIDNTLVLSRIDNKQNDAYSLTNPQEPLGGRYAGLASIWKEAGEKRHLPPSVEMILYANDKPRVRSDLGLPTFTMAGSFTAGSGLPSQWTNHLPFPSYFYLSELQEQTDFWDRAPILHFRGRFSENCWSRFKTHKFQWTQTPRFKLALGTSNPSDSDVLDVKLTDFGSVKEPLATEIREALGREYNITMVEWSEQGSVQSRYALAVSGNGWAGATFMRALLSGSCVLFVNDNSTDYEGFSRDLGEIYFPLLEEGKDFVQVDYNTIAQTVRELNAVPERAYNISQAGLKFAKKYLGPSCALDIVELLAWNYYQYVSKGCPQTFSHVQLRE